MFEETLDRLTREYHALMERLDAGKKALDRLDKDDSQYISYINHYNYLKAMATRASACIDILGGDVDLIAEHGNNLVVVKRINDGRTKMLLEEAQRLGGFISDISADEGH